MKLKDKKIDIQGVQYVTDKYGNHKKETVTIATVWAYFRQLSGNEINNASMRGYGSEVGRCGFGQGYDSY